jgi:hypothetical protein
MIQANNNSHRASHTRTDIKEKFTDGFAVITAELIQSGIWAKLEDRHRKVLPCVLSHYPDIRPGLKRLTKLSGCSKSTVVRALKEMDHIGLLLKESRFTNKGDQDTNRYALAEMKKPETVKAILRYLDHDQFLQLTNNLYAGGKHDIDRDVIEMLSPQGMVPDRSDNGGVRSNEPRVVSDRMVTKKQGIRDIINEHAGIDFDLYADCSTNTPIENSTIQALESQSNPSTDSLSTTLDDSSTVLSTQCESVPENQCSTATASTSPSAVPDKHSDIPQTETSAPLKTTSDKMAEVIKLRRESYDNNHTKSSTIQTEPPHHDTDPPREPGVGESYIDPVDGSKIFINTDIPQQKTADYASSTPRQIRQARAELQTAIYQDNNIHQDQNIEIKQIEKILEDEAELNDQNHTLAVNLVCDTGYSLEELSALITDTKKKAKTCPEGLLLKRLKDGDRFTVIDGYDKSIPAHHDTMERAVNWMEERGIVSGGQRKLLASHLKALIELQYYEYWANDMLEYFCIEFCLEDTAPPGVVVAKMKSRLGQFLEESLEGAKENAAYLAKEAERALTN